MTYKSKYNTHEGCSFKGYRYTNGNLAVRIENDEGVVTTVTTNTSVVLNDRLIAVKNYSENEGIEETLRENGIIGRCAGYISSGWVNIPVYELTEKGREIFKGV